MKKQIGIIGVDAGLCWVGDPCYVFGDDATKRWPKWLDFITTINDIDNQPLTQQYNYPKGHPGLGVLVSTGYGDGRYPVYAEIEDGRVKSITVEFFGDELEEDECLTCGEVQSNCTCE